MCVRVAIAMYAGRVLLVLSTRLIARDWTEAIEDLVPAVGRSSYVFGSDYAQRACRRTTLICPNWITLGTVLLSLIRAVDGMYATWTQITTQGFSNIGRGWTFKLLRRLNSILNVSSLDYTAANDYLGIYVFLRYVELPIISSPLTAYQCRRQKHVSCVMIMILLTTGKRCPQFV